MPNENKKLSAEEIKSGRKIYILSGDFTKEDAEHLLKADFLKINGIGFISMAKAVELFDSYAAQQCVEKDKEIERLRLIGLDREEHLLALKQKADKLSIAINAFRDYCKYHNILLGSGIIEQVQEAITNYEKQ